MGYSPILRLTTIWIWFRLVIWLTATAASEMIQQYWTFLIRRTLLILEERKEKKNEAVKAHWCYYNIKQLFWNLSSFLWMLFKINNFHVVLNFKSVSWHHFEMIEIDSKKWKKKLNYSIQTTDQLLTFIDFWSNSNFRSNWQAINLKKFLMHNKKNIGLIEKNWLLRLSI